MLKIIETEKKNTEGGSVSKLLTGTVCNQMINNRICLKEWGWKQRVNPDRKESQSQEQKIRGNKGTGTTIREKQMSEATGLM